MVYPGSQSTSKATTNMDVDSPAGGTKLDETTKSQSLPTELLAMVTPQTVPTVATLPTEMAPRDPAMAVSDLVSTFHQQAVRFGTTAQKAVKRATGTTTPKKRKSSKSISKSLPKTPKSPPGSIATAPKPSPKQSKSLQKDPPHVETIMEKVSASTPDILTTLSSSSSEDTKSNKKWRRLKKSSIRLFYPPLLTHLTLKL